MDSSYHSLRCPFPLVAHPQLLLLAMSRFAGEVPRGTGIARNGWRIMASCLGHCLGPM